MLKSDPRARQGLADIEELEDRIEKLKQNYESFFAGVDNIDPAEKKIPIRRLITKLNELHLLNPRARFRFQTLVGRFVTLEQYWTRTLRMIEEGRLKRGFFRVPVVGEQGPKTFFSKNDVDMSGLKSVQEAAAESATKAERPATESLEELRARRMAKLRRGRLLDDAAQEGSEESAGVATAPASSASPAPPAAATTAPATPAAPAAPAYVPPISRERVESLFHDLQQARQQCGQAADEMNRDAFAAQLWRQAQLLREKYAGQDVDFRVVQKEGKVVLQPVVRKPNA